MSRVCKTGEWVVTFSKHFYLSIQYPNNLPAMNSQELMTWIGHELKWKNSTNVSFDVEDLPHY